MHVSHTQVKCRYRHMRNRLGHYTDMTDGCKLRTPSVHICRLRAIKSEQSSHFTAGETEALRGERTCPKSLSNCGPGHQLS